MKTKFFFLLCAIWGIALMFSGCSFIPDIQNTGNNSAAADGTITVGNYLTVKDVDSRLTLLNNMDTLSANGLYYASWTMGSSEPYENSDGETVDLYDAQLYLLAGEYKDAEAALDNQTAWLDAAKTNYDVSTEEEITCNNQLYTLITYNCVKEENPYARGVSAFGVYKECAVCIELTCREGFEEDLNRILVDFLEHCGYDG
ncbi:MAG: hypothetical protein NC318_09515 [Blautia sp.]|nr:hypothetical protein [Lachnoclostridium sp.]MCM1211827.1 hypothetical protein [Blautia sp.]